LLKSL